MTNRYVKLERHVPNAMLDPSGALRNTVAKTSESAVNKMRKLAATTTSSEVWRVRVLSVRTLAGAREAAA